ncbi:msm operon regulatory protein [Streptococcus pneumoniae]|nr:msm operon regulatory protein [Streptococcus pneumoniae]
MAYYWLGITGGKSPDYFALSQISDQSYLIQSETCHTQTTAKLISDIVRFAQITKSSELAQLHIMGQLHELMFHLGTVAPNQKKKNISSTHQLYLECKRLIDSHYPQSLTIQDLAKELSVHRSYLSSVFKEFNTLSPKEYLLYVRMHRARQLLENTQESIKVIAYSVGFSDPLHFSKAYKQYFNQTPSHTRKEYSQYQLVRKATL